MFILTLQKSHWILSSNTLNTRSNNIKHLFKTYVCVHEFRHIFLGHELRQLQSRTFPQFSDLLLAHSININHSFEDISEVFGRGVDLQLASIFRLQQKWHWEASGDYHGCWKKITWNQLEIRHLNIFIETLQKRIKKHHFVISKKCKILVQNYSIWLQKWSNCDRISLVLSMFSLTLY